MGYSISEDYVHAARRGSLPLGPITTASSNRSFTFSERELAPVADFGANSKPSAQPFRGILRLTSGRANLRHGVPSSW